MVSVRYRYSSLFAALISFSFGRKSVAPPPSSHDNPPAPSSSPCPTGAGSGGSVSIVANTVTISSGGLGMIDPFTVTTDQTGAKINVSGGNAYGTAGSGAPGYILVRTSDEIGGVLAAFINQTGLSSASMQGLWKIIA